MYCIDSSTTAKVAHLLASAIGLSVLLSRISRRPVAPRSTCNRAEGLFVADAQVPRGLIEVKPTRFFAPVPPE
jgi:hypothetical protein